MAKQDFQGGPRSGRVAGKRVEFTEGVRDIARRSFDIKRACGSGRSVVWYARLLGVQEVVSSNLTAPTILHKPV
jgi:hypothetical protein